MEIQNKNCAIGGIKQRKSDKRRRNFSGGCAKELARPLLHARSLLHIGNSDGICLARSVVTAIAKAEHRKGSRLFAKMCKNTFDLQTRAALNLLRWANLPTDLAEYNLKHAKKIQKALNNRAPCKFRIVILDGNNFYRVIFKGEPAKNNLFILLHNGHFQPIGRPGELFRVG